MADDIQTVIKSFHIRDQLEPNVWDDGKLNPKVRKILMRVAEHFIRSWKIDQDIEIKDIRFTGSLAAFNWSRYSDIDLHIIVDFDEVNENQELVERFFTLAKSRWNDRHDVRVGPYEIEVYVENEGEKHMATGLYSVMNDEWIKEPTREDATFDEDDIRTKSKYFFHMLPILVKQFNDKEYGLVIRNIERMKEKIRRMRQSGLSKGGQFSTENLVFKVLRRTDFLGKVNKILTKATDKKLAEKKNVRSESYVRRS